MINLNYSISTTNECNFIGITYVGELEVHAVVTCHCAKYSVCPGPLLIVLNLALIANALDTPGLIPHICFKSCLLLGGKRLLSKTSS